MFITLPLTLFGVGLLIHYLFGAATHALPLVAGVAVGFATSALGLATPLAILVGVLSALLTIGAGRFAGLTARGPLGRGLLTAAFAIPAVLVGGALGGALAKLTGFTNLAMVAALLAGLACGLVAANRLATRDA